MARKYDWYDTVHARLTEPESGKIDGNVLTAFGQLTRAIQAANPDLDVQMSIDYSGIVIWSPEPEDKKIVRWLQAEQDYLRKSADA